MPHKGDFRMSNKVKRYLAILFVAMMIFGSQIACSDGEIGWQGNCGDLIQCR
jgi:hypothetical protein